MKHFCYGLHLLWENYAFLFTDSFVNGQTGVFLSGLDIMRHRYREIQQDVNCVEIVVNTPRRRIERALFRLMEDRLVGLNLGVKGKCTELTVCRLLSVGSEKNEFYRCTGSQREILRR